MNEIRKLALNNNGFTLIEVLMAMAIFSIGILATVAMQYSVVAGNTSGNVQNQEMLLAQRIIEAKKNTPDIRDIDTSIPADIDPGPYTITITPPTTPLGSATRFISVTVDRPGGIGGHPITVSSLIAGSGI